MHDLRSIYFHIISIFIYSYKQVSRMNQAKEKIIPQRNITPNFIRFKRKRSSGKPTTPEEDHQKTERSESRGSKVSFEVYEKRVLNLSKLKANLGLKKKGQQRNVQSMKKKIIQINSKRGSSIDHEQTETQNNIYQTHRMATEGHLQRKRSLGGSGNIIKQYPRDKYSNPKRTQDSLQKEQERAKKTNVDLFANMFNHQNAPNYLNKLKIKKNEHLEKRKTKKKLLTCNVQIKNEQAIKSYEIFGELGKGAYGLVRMGIDRRINERVAIKVYEKKRLDEANKIKNLQRQINILSYLDHPIIAKLIETIQTTNQIYLILEYGGANSLYNYLLSKPEHRLTQSEAKLFFKTITQTLGYLHDLNIVHRDIKAQNILLNRYKHLKLIDFGFSIQSKPPNEIDTFCGTPTYMAPEIVSKRDHVPVYTDMWSLGILYYVMLQGNYPFRAKTENQLFQKIRRGKFDYIYSDTSEESKKVIEGLLKVNPLERLTVKDLLSEQYLSWYAQN